MTVIFDLEKNHKKKLELETIFLDEIKISEGEEVGMKISKREISIKSYIENQKIREIKTKFGMLSFFKKLYSL